MDHIPVDTRAWVLHPDIWSREEAARAAFAAALADALAVYLARWY